LYECVWSHFSLFLTFRWNDTKLPFNWETCQKHCMSSKSRKFLNTTPSFTILHVLHSSHSWYGHLWLPRAFPWPSQTLPINLELIFSLSYQISELNSSHNSMLEKYFCQIDLRDGPNCSKRFVVRKTGFPNTGLDNELS